MQPTTIDNVPDDVLGSILGFCSVHDLFLGAWALNKRTNDLLRVTPRVWLNAYCAQWGLNPNELNPNQDWAELARVRLTEELMQLHPVAPFSTTVNDLIKKLMGDHDPKTVVDRESSKAALTFKINEAQRHIKWYAALRANWKAFLESVRRQNGDDAVPAGVDIVSSMLIGTHAYYPLSVKRANSEDADSRLKKVFAQFAVYSPKGVACRFQYHHSWYDAGGGRGFDMPRQLGLWYNEKGIVLATAESAKFNKENYLAAKCDLLGVAANDPQRDSKLSLVADSVILALLFQIGVYCDNWSSRPNPLFQYELCDPFKQAVEACDNVMSGKADSVSSDDGNGIPTWRGGAAITPSYVDLLRITNEKPNEAPRKGASKEEEGADQDASDEPEEKWANDAYSKYSLASGRPVPFRWSNQLAWPELVKSFPEWERSRKSHFESSVRVVRAQMSVQYHVTSWLKKVVEPRAKGGLLDASAPHEYAEDTTGVELIRDLLNKCDIVIQYFGKTSELDRGVADFAERCSFVIQPRPRVDSGNLTTTGFSYSCSTTYNSWGDPFDADKMRLEYFVDGSELRHEVISVSGNMSRVLDSGKPIVVVRKDSKKESEPSIDEKKKAFMLLDIKNRLFGNPQAQLSAEMLLGFLFVVGRAGSQWRADGTNLYMKTNDDIMHRLQKHVVLLFKMAMSAAKETAQLARSLDFVKDKAFAPPTPEQIAEEKRQEEEKKRFEAQQKHQLRLAKQEKALKSLALDSGSLKFSLSKSGGGFAFPSSFSSPGAEKTSLIRSVPSGSFFAGGAAYFVDVSAWPPAVTPTGIDGDIVQLSDDGKLAVVSVETRTKIGENSTSVTTATFLADCSDPSQMQLKPTSELVGHLNGVHQQATGAQWSPFVNDVPLKGFISNRMFVMESRSGVPMYIESAAHSGTFFPLKDHEGKMLGGSNGQQMDFRNKCRQEKCQQMLMRALPTLNMPAGFLPKGVLLFDGLLLIPVEGDQCSPVSVFDAEGKEPVSVIIRESGFIQSYSGADGSVRLFCTMYGGFFELIWDPSRPLTMRCIPIAIGPLASSNISYSISAWPLGIVVETVSFEDENTCCQIIRIPEVIKDFSSAELQRVRNGASVATLQWTDFGFPEQPNPKALSWARSTESLLLVAPPPAKIEQEDFSGPLPGSFHPGPFGFSKPSSPETQIRSLSMEILLSIVEWKRFEDVQSVPMPVKPFRPQHPEAFKFTPTHKFFSRAEFTTLPKLHPSKYTIVAAWEKVPGRLPEPFLHPKCKRYNTPQELVAEHLSCLAFVELGGDFGFRLRDESSTRLTMASILDFVDRNSSMPKSFYTETAQEGSYSGGPRSFDSPVWIGVVDYVPELAENPERLGFVVSAGF